MGALDFIEKEFEQCIPITERVRKAVVGLFDLIKLKDGMVVGEPEYTSSQIAHALASIYSSCHIEDEEYSFAVDGHIVTAVTTIGDETRVEIPNLWKWVELFDALREAYQNKESGRSDSE